MASRRILPPSGCPLHAGMALVGGLRVVMPAAQALQVARIQVGAALADGDGVIDGGGRFATDPAVGLPGELLMTSPRPGSGLVERLPFGVSRGVLGPV